MSTIEAQIFVKSGLVPDGELATIDLEYGSITLHGTHIASITQPDSYYAMYEDEKFLVSREQDHFFVSDSDLDDLRNHAMG
jgi:hypothetical protein